MFKKISIRKIVPLLLLTIALVGCKPTPQSSDTSEPDTTTEEATMLHFTFPFNDPENYPYPYIGDVHPFYDQASETWYMFYLDTSGQFHSKLLTSKDGVSWVENKDFWIHSGLQNYAVLNVFERDGVYWSYYAEYHASRSTDLINWYYAGGEYQIPHDSAQFPGGMRDPSVTYDEETNTYYAIGLNYPQRIFSEGIYESNLAITKSIGDNQKAWEPHHNKVFATNLMNKDFECPQLLKIGRRWYVVASQYGNSIHGVGRTSYLIGDLDKNPFEINWQTKTLHHLTTEDLCAAQIAKKDDKFYIYGWIPKEHNRGFWGGFINLPTEVYALEDGTLATRFDSEFAAKVRGANVDKIEEDITLNIGEKVEVNTFNRLDNEYHFTMSDDAVLEIKQEINNYRIVVTNSITAPKVQVFTATYNCFTYDLRPGALAGDNVLRVLGEGRNLEIALNDTYVLTSRIERSLTLDGETDTNIVVAKQGTINLSLVSANKLKKLSEL